MKPTTNPPNLPRPFAAYFAADRDTSEAVSQCFTENAVVKDEGHTHQGRAAIKKWKADASAKYQYTCEPLACEERDGKTVVTGHLVGNFPGSPVDLRFFFKLEGDKIASLEIIPKSVVSGREAEGGGGEGLSGEHQEAKGVITLRRQAVCGTAD